MVCTRQYSGCTNLNTVVLDFITCPLKPLDVSRNTSLSGTVASGNTATCYPRSNAIIKSPTTDINQFAWHEVNLRLRQPPSPTPAPQIQTGTGRSNLPDLVQLKRQQTDFHSCDSWCEPAYKKLPHLWVSGRCWCFILWSPHTNDEKPLSFKRNRTT